MDIYEAMALRARGRHLHFVGAHLMWYALHALHYIGPFIPLAEVPTDPWLK